ncbi:MAG: tRNA guanosine(34) transglycosylase Tgt [Patescibacteria group bacterium]
MFQFEIEKHSKKSLARKGIIKMSHGEVKTPAFLPCATFGTVKGISFEELKVIGFEMILANTYHLYLRPGDGKIKKMGGLNQFIGWQKPILTDSGGYQIFSLGKNYTDYQKVKNKKKSLAEIDSEGVTFKSHLDGGKHFFSPEKIIDIQKNLGSDIMMVLDECTEYPASYQRAEQSIKITHLWAKKSIDYWQRFKNPKQALFGIVQGSVYRDLRNQSVDYISSLPFDGLAVGGVSVGEGKIKMRKVIRWMGPKLPIEKPHYLMGVGEPEDIIEAIKWGFDLFDSVLPTRLGRHGTCWTTNNWQNFSKINLKSSRYQTDKRTIQKNCQCFSCQKGYSRAYLGHLFKNKEMLGLRLASLHNLWIIRDLLRRIRKSI